MERITAALRGRRIEAVNARRYMTIDISFNV